MRLNCLTCGSESVGFSEGRATFDRMAFYLMPNVTSLVVERNYLIVSAPGFEPIVSPPFAVYATVAERTVRENLLAAVPVRTSFRLDLDYDKYAPAQDVARAAFRTALQQEICDALLLSSVGCMRVQMVGFAPGSIVVDVQFNPARVTRPDDASLAGNRLTAADTATPSELAWGFVAQANSSESALRSYVGNYMRALAPNSVQVDETGRNLAAPENAVTIPYIDPAETPFYQTIPFIVGVVVGLVVLIAVIVIAVICVFFRPPPKTGPNASERDTEENETIVAPSHVNLSLQATTRGNPKRISKRSGFSV